MCRSCLGVVFACAVCLNSSGSEPQFDLGGEKHKLILAKSRSNKAEDKRLRAGQPQVSSRTSAGGAASLSVAAHSLADAALDAASENPTKVSIRDDSKDRNFLTLEGKPGDVRLVCMTTGVIKREKSIVPPLPIPPFYQWRKWLNANQDKARHCALDWMDDEGRWWHTELRGYDHHPAQYRVGEGEFVASGVTIYGIFILPGRTDREDQKVIFDELVKCDYRIIEREARVYGRKDKRRGEPGTGGAGKKNVGLGGPAFKPSQSSNTYISHLLRKAGVTRKAPEGAVGWDTIPRFPYSSDADAYGP